MSALEKRRREIREEAVDNIREIFTRLSEGAPATADEQGMDENDLIAYRAAQIGYRAAIVASMAHDNPPPPFVILGQWASVALEAETDAALSMALDAVAGMMGDGPVH